MRRGNDDERRADCKNGIVRWHHEGCRGHRTPGLHWGRDHVSEKRATSLLGQFWDLYGRQAEGPSGEKSQNWRGVADSCCQGPKVFGREEFKVSHSVSCTTV